MEFIGVSAAASIATIGALAARYRVSKAHQFLIRTGPFIRAPKGIKITKNGMQWPFQTYKFIDTTPQQHPFNLTAMSNEKLQFGVPGHMTIGPKTDEESLTKYAELLSNTDPENLVRGIIEGELRISAASMPIDALFQDRKAFKDHITKAVEKELEPFGLAVWNCNISEITDVPGSEFFSYRRAKAREEANNDAHVAVAQAQMKGIIGAKEREATQRQEQARLEAQARRIECDNEQTVKQVEMELEQRKIEYHRLNATTRMEAEQSIAIRNTQLQTELEEQRFQQELKKARADAVVPAEIQASTATIEAEGKAEAQRRHANAVLYAAEKQAQATLLTMQAEADGISKIVQSLGNNSTHFLWYRFAEQGVLQRLAEANAEAVKGLAPNVTVWNTGSGDGSSGNAFRPIQDLFQFLPPLLTTIAEQTKLQVPFVNKDQK